MKLSPSKLELISHCPAAPYRSEPFPFEDNAAAARGRDLHERVALGLKSGPEGYDAILDGLSDDDASAVRTCWEVADSLRPKGIHQRWFEEKLDLSFLGMPSGGTPDLVYFDGDSGTVCVVDWKFGKGPVPDPMENKQLIAYALGIAENKIKWLFKKAYLVVCQPDPANGKPYRDALIEAEDFPDWEKKILEWINAAKVQKPVALPGPWCKRQYCDAAKHDACRECLEWAKNAKEEKEQEKEEKAIAAVSGFDPICVDGVPGPIVVIDSAAVEKAENLRENALKIAVTDQESANQAGICLSEITRFMGMVETSRKIVKAPVLDLGKKIDAEAGKALGPLADGMAGLKSRLNAWMAEQEAISRRERSEADRKLREAQEAQRKAEQEAMNAKNDKDRQEALKRAEVAKAEALTPIPVSAPVKIDGVKSQKVPVFEVTDFSAMPDTYKLTNESLIKKAITTKALTGKEPWLKVEWVDQTSSTGRR